jgi:hypothetical protein
VKSYKLQVISYKLPVILILAAVFMVLGCQKVDKPLRDGTGPLAITIEVDEAPESHTDSVTSEGDALINPNSKIPVLGKLFKSGLKGLDFWKANHPLLVTGLDNPVLIADPEETCLDCHEVSTSCNNCHSYVGVKMVSGEE